MANWIARISGKEPASASKAKERLKLVLIHDRTDLTPEALENLKNDLLDVISRYVSIDPESVRISMNQEGREQRLVADVPIKATVRRKIN
ncbi:MAG TPA: cell division topological specificity factor MinE [Longilinea sp.]|nr:cell division topological specificity factor MinE [Longilinea sp.]